MEWLVQTAVRPALCSDFPASRRANFAWTARPKFPDKQGKYREFAALQLKTRPMGRKKIPTNQRLMQKFPVKNNREFFRANREFILKCREFCE
jgi:hypothetical protein